MIMPFKKQGGFLKKNYQTVFSLFIVYIFQKILNTNINIILLG